MNKGSHSSPMQAAVLIALLLLGMLHRTLLAFPTHKYLADADAIGSALCAFDVLRGDNPTFMIAERLGSFGCHLSALLFKIFGISRAALVSGPMLVGWLLLPVWYLFLRELLGSRVALAAAPFVALPAPAFAFWLYMPNSYPETLLFCCTTLWLAARLARGAADRATMIGLGLAAGLGWWNSLLSLCCSVPAAAWLLWRRPGLLRNRSFLGHTLFGLLVGAAPWLLFNFRHSMLSLRDPRLASATQGWMGKVDNLVHVLTYDLPELVAGQGHMLPNQSFLSASLSTVALILCSAAIVVFLAAPLFRRKWKIEELGQGLKAPPWLLGGLIIATTIALKVLSAAGENRGLTVRYILPLYLMVPGILAVFLLWLGRFSRPLACLCGSLLLAFHVFGAELPGTPVRRQLSARAAEDRELLKILEAQGIEAVAGRFWIVYPLNFLSRERILGLPLEKRMDLNHVARRLPEKGVRWALLASRSDELDRCVRAAGLVGAQSHPTQDNWLFVPAENPPPGGSRAFFERLHRTCHKRMGVNTKKN